MGFRWRRSVQIVPGVRLNFSKSGISTSIGGKGITVNLKPGRTRTTVGIPGTGLSYTASISSSSRARSESVERKAAGLKPEVVRLTNTISGDTDSDVGTAHDSRPAETTYRVAALLASVLIADADRNQVLIRLVGLMPEYLPNGMSGVQWAHLLLSSTLSFAGKSTTGTPAIRRAIEKSGLLHTSMVPDAVRAVRGSLKARAGSGVDPSSPVEWYKEGGELRCREYEAASLRIRVPAEALTIFHAKQLELGRERLLVPQRPPPSVAAFILKSLLKGFLVLALLAAALYFAGRTNTWW